MVDAFELRVHAGERVTPFVDVFAQTAAVARAADHAHTGELARRPVQLLRLLCSLLLKRSPPVDEQAGLPAEPGAIAGVIWVAARPGGVGGEALRSGARECFGEPVDGAGWLGPVRRCVRFELVRDRVKAGLFAGAGEGDVAPLPQRTLAVGEDERALDGQSLRLVAGERVRVGDVAGVEVGGGQRELPVAIELEHE